jgi:cyclic di-GMP phosphodiesterase Gmr
MPADWPIQNPGVSLVITIVSSQEMKDTVLVLGDLFNVLPDAMVVVDGAGNIVFANAAVRVLLGYEPDELLEQPLGCLIPERQRETHSRHFEKFRARGKATAMGARPLLNALHKSGSEVSISISIANLDLAGRRYSVAVMRDSSELQSEITDATFRAETDALTGIGNRLRLSREIRAALAASRPFGLLFLDLEKFKPFNDDYGHAIGDQVLQVVARRLQAQIRLKDLAVRLGGDEFVLVLDGLVDTDLLEQRAIAVAASVSRPFHIGELSAAVGVNIGAAIYPGDGETEDEILKVADQNMYHAKLSGVPYHIGKKKS